MRVRKSISCVGRRAEKVPPAAEPQRRCNAYADHFAGFRAERLVHAREFAFERREQRTRIGICVLKYIAAYHTAAEVHRQHVETAPPHLDADRVRAVRAQCDRHRGLADPAAHARLFFEQPVFDQTVDDHRHRLHRKTREAAHVGFR
jgi:hypothetical protein